MLAFEARTRTIRVWTGVSRDRVRKLALTVAAATHSTSPVRHRGSSPWQIEYFFRSRRLAQHASALGALLHLNGVVPFKPGAIAIKDFPSIPRGERLCDAYDAYGLITPNPAIDFEHAVLLSSALATGNEVKLATCEGCGALLVVDRFARGIDGCRYCEPGAEELFIAEVSAQKSTLSAAARDPDQLDLFRHGYEELHDQLTQIHDDSSDRVEHRNVLAEIDIASPKPHDSKDVCALTTSTCNGGHRCDQVPQEDTSADIRAHRDIERKP
jgi:hypothetical protein